MDNINIQTQAARLAFTERKLKKADAPGVLETLYNQAGDDATRLQLARLYATLTPKVATKKNPLSWVAQACSKDESQPAMRNIFIRDGYAIATDGFRLHFYKLQFDSAEYDGKFIDCDFNVLDLPGVKPLDATVLAHFWPNVSDMPYTQQINLSDCEVVSVLDGRYMAYKMGLFETVYHFDKRFVEQMAPGEACFTVYAKEVGSRCAVWFNAGGNKTAFLMPVRV